MTPAAPSSSEDMATAHDPIDRVAPEEAVALMVAAQCRAAESVATQGGSIAAAAGLATAALRQGARIVYCGAGSSGLMALGDALELPGTFGIPRDRVAILLAEGLGTIADFASALEDSEDRAERDFAALDAQPGDCFLIVSASGTTPYAVALARSAAARGCATVAIVANPGTVLAQLCGVTILAGAGAEVVAGSTRLGAATAAKIALNAISTLTGVMLGHVHAGRMVNLDVVNRKLECRAQGIVADLAGVDVAEAGRSLSAAGGNVKLAILIARGAQDTAGAATLLEAAGGRLDAALAALEQTGTAQADRVEDRNQPGRKP